MIFVMYLPWGIVMPIHLVKCTKLITLYAFLTQLLMYRFCLGIFCLFFSWSGVYDQLTPLACAIELFSFAGTKI
jgi:uncharacterized membrane protein